MNKIKSCLFIFLLVIFSIISLLGFNNIDVSANDENEIVLNVYKNNISYSSEIFILYAVEYENIDLDNNEISMLFFDEEENEYVKGNEVYVTYSKGLEEVEGKECLIFYSYGLAAKEMTDYVYSRLYVNIDGVDYYSEINRYSVLEYVYEIKEYKELSEEEIEFFDNMLAYGASAQKIFDYKEETLANDNYYKINVTDGFLEKGFNFGLYQLNEKISLSAYDEKDGVSFGYWEDQRGIYLGKDKTIEVEVNGDMEYVAVYTNNSVKDFYFEEEIDYNDSISELDLPTEIELEYNGTTISIPIEFDISTFVSGQIGKQRIYANVTDTTLLDEYNIVIPSICMDVNVLGFDMELIDNSYTIVKYLGEDKDVIVPSKYKGLEVSKIGSFAFADLEINNLYFSKTVKELQEFAFENSVVKNVYYDGSLEEWCSIIFSNKHSNPLNLGGSFHLLNENSEWYEITEIVVPSTISTINAYAFQGFNKLTSVEIPSSIIHIGASAFEQCLKLEKVYYDGTVESWLNFDLGDTYSNPMFYAKQIYMMNENSEWDVVKEIVIPDGTLEIPQYRFNNFSSVVDVTLPASLQRINSAVFNMCTSIENVYYKGLYEQWFCITIIGEFSTPMRYASNFYIYDGSEWVEPTTIDVPEFCDRLNRYKLYNFDQMKSIYIPDTVTVIEQSVFTGCTSLEDVYYFGTLEQWSNIIYVNEDSNPMTYANNLYVKDETGNWVKHDKLEFTLDWQESNRYVRNADEIRTLFLTDFYNWCVKQGAFDKESISLDTFIGEKFDGIWFNYTGTPGNPSNIYTHFDSQNIQNYMLDPSDLNGTATVIEDTKYFFNDASMNEKWDNFMIYLESIFKSNRGWSKMDPYYIYDLGRYMQSYTGANPYISSTTMNAVPSAYKYYSIPSAGLENVSTVIDANGYKLPVAVKDGYTYVGWSDGVNIYKTIKDEEVNGKVLVPLFINTEDGHLEIPEGVVEIEDDLFNDIYNLKTIKLPSTLQTIGEYAFAGTGLVSIEIPSGVTFIASSAFNNCRNLSEIIVNEENTRYDSRDNCNAIIETETNTLVIGCKCTVIPNTVTSIGNYAFSGHSYLTNIVIPESVTSIGNYSFRGCTSLINIVIPEGVISIGDYAFGACMNLGSIEIPESVTSIGIGAFSNCSRLTSIIIPDGVTAIKDYTFAECNKLSSVQIGDNVTSIGWYAFCNCESLQYLVLPDNIQSIGYQAFWSCTNLKDITMGNKISSIGSFAFENNYSLQNVYYNGTIEDWCKMEFYSLYSNPLYYGAELFILDDNNEYYNPDRIVVPDTITQINKYTFANYNGFTHITIPNSVTKIMNDAFYNCNQIKEIYFDGTNEELNNLSSNSFTDLFNRGITILTKESVGDDSLNQTIFKIKYYLNGGESTTELVNEYTMLTNTFALPNEEEMTKEGYFFLGWYTNKNGIGEMITEIEQGSLGDKELFAKWIVDQTKTIDLSEDEEKLIQNYNPTKYVLQNSELGKYKINETTYIYGIDIFSDLNEAIEVAEANEVIYVFAGDYTLYTDINKSLTILGPNADKVSQDDRNAEASILVLLNETQVYGEKVAFNGLSFKGNTDPSNGGIFFSSRTGLSELTFKSSNINYGNTFIKTEYGYNITINMLDCRISEIGQFVIWTLAGTTKETNVRGCYFDGTDCGVVVNENAAMIRVVSGDAYIYNNTFVGDTLATNGGYFCNRGTGVYEVKYNTFIDVTKFICFSSSTNHVFDCNLYITNDQVASASPVGGSGVKADITVSTSSEDLATRWGNYLLCYENNKHDEIEHEGKAATCTETGYKAYVTCSRCDYSTYEVIDALGHDYSGEWIIEVEATNESVGIKYKKCLRDGCEAKNVVEIPMLPYSDGLIYELNDTNDGYIVTGIGDCSDTEIKITPIYKELPVVGIGPDAFKESSITGVIMPEGITSIESYAFYNCKFISDVQIPSTVTYIGSYAFRGCEGLTNIVVPEGIKKIERATFASCFNIETISLPSTLEVIGYSAFSSCTSLKNIEIPNTVVLIDGYAFNNCSSLEQIIIPLSVEQISYFAFELCPNLEIYCEATSEPDGWTSWNTYNCPVIWGYTENN